MHLSSLLPRDQRRSSALTSYRMLPSSSKVKSMFLKRHASSWTKNVYLMRVSACFIEKKPDHRPKSMIKRIFKSDSQVIQSARASTELNHHQY